MNRTQQLIVFALSYLGWFACILAGKHEIGAWVFLVPLLFFGVYSRFVKFTGTHLVVFLIIAMIGISFDSISLRLGWFQLSAPYDGPLLPPWLLSLWLLFGCAIPLYDGWLRGRMWLAALMGSFVGPLSYRSGAAFGTVTFPDKFVFLYYGIFWACFFPSSFLLYEHLLRSRSKILKPAPRSTDPHITDLHPPV